VTKRVDERVGGIGLGLARRTGSQPVEIEVRALVMRSTIRRSEALVGRDPGGAPGDCLGLATFHLDLALERAPWAGLATQGTRKRLTDRGAGATP
jgi:hypothetical protein